MEPKKLTSKSDREMARRIRDEQWAFMEKVASIAPAPLWWCIWNKDGHHKGTEGPDQHWGGLIDGMELSEWMHQHSDWWVKGEWDDDRYARPVWLTDAGREALAKRAAYDLEPVTGGMVEPGWEAIPLPQDSRKERVG